MLAALELSDTFSSSNIFRLALDQKMEEEMIFTSKNSEKGRMLFSEGITYSLLMSRLNAGGKIESFEISKSYPFEEFKRDYSDAILLFYVTVRGRLVTISEQPDVGRDSVKTVIALV